MTFPLTEKQLLCGNLITISYYKLDKHVPNDDCPDRSKPVCEKLQSRYFAELKCQIIGIASPIKVTCSGYSEQECLARIPEAKNKLALKLSPYLSQLSSDFGNSPTPIGFFLLRQSQYALRWGASRRKVNQSILLSLLQGMGTKPIKDITREDCIKAWEEEYPAAGGNEKNLAKREHSCKLLFQFFEYCLVCGLSESDNPLNGITYLYRKGKKKGSLSRINPSGLSPEDTRKLCDFAINHYRTNIAAVLVLLLFNGLTVEEACGLSFAQLVPSRSFPDEAGVIIDRRYHMDYDGKLHIDNQLCSKYSYRQIPLFPATFRAISFWQQHYTQLVGAETCNAYPIIGNLRREKPYRISPEKIEILLKSLGQELSISTPLNPNIFREALGLYLRNGRSANCNPTVSYLLGYAQEKTEAAYYCDFLADDLQHYMLKTMLDVFPILQ